MRLALILETTPQGVVSFFFSALATARPCVPSLPTPVSLGSRGGWGLREIRGVRCGHPLNPFMEEHMSTNQLPESVCISPADPMDLVVIYPTSEEGKEVTFDSEEFENFLRKELSL